ncbi:MAG: carbohydrate kinase family protein [Chitinophagaceae bacterium]|nr:carbohydrate kinase family protein [Chitinophagaceae bacterium]
MTNNTVPEKPFEVMAIADLCMDIIVASSSPPEFGQVELLADAYQLDLGGSVGIFATQYAKLGGRIALIGTTGDDAAGTIVHTKLSEAGVDIRYIKRSPGEKTAMGLNIAVGHDRAMLAYLGTMELIGPDMLRDEWIGLSRHWHIGSYFLLRRLIPAWSGWLKELKSGGITVSLDTNWDPSGNWAHVTELLPHVDIFLPNLAEALAITGETTLQTAGAKLAGICKLVVVKCGEDGAAVFSEGRHSLYPVTPELTRHLKIADTTGAGDNFDAGFIYCWLQGEDIAACIDEASRCAVSSLQSLGGIIGQIVKNKHT